MNLSRIIRTAGCCGVARIVCGGVAKVIRKIARDGADGVVIEVHRTLPPVLKEFRAEGYELVALEQTTGSENLHSFVFKRRTVLIIGNEREGIDEAVINLADRVAEIPVWGLPYAYNAATAASMALYEYCRQFPEG